MSELSLRTAAAVKSVVAFNEAGNEKNLNVIEYVRTEPANEKADYLESAFS